MSAIHESGENYLECILRLQASKGTVHSIDVAHEMGVSKPSVSRAVGILKEKGYLRMDADGVLTLTESGKEIAERIYERHRVLTAWLVGLGVSEAQAAEDACKLEHDISAESFACLKRHLAEKHPEFASLHIE